MTINVDYGSVKNGDRTYETIASDLVDGRAVVIGWTDEEMSHFDILFVLRPVQYGSLQGGVSGKTDLFVSVMRRGSFGFDVARSNPGTHPTYYAEKLGMGNGGETMERMADLINGVRVAVQSAEAMRWTEKLD